MFSMPTRWRQWLGCGGCIVVLAALFAFLVSIAHALGPLLFALVLAAIGAIWWRIVHAKQRAIAAFRAANRTTGKDVLVVYTDSPLWKEYIETHWLPRWGERAIAFDRSKPWREDQVEARLWRAVAGTAEHTPVVIVVLPHGRVQIVRFWLAFRDYKHGKDARLRDAEARLAVILGETST
jgi:hypothetical protein